MNHFQRLKKLAIFRWACLSIVNNNVRLCVLENGWHRIAPNIRFYATSDAEKPRKLVRKTSQISHVARKEAQAVRLEYLHSTRSLQFSDAETMSKNSPHFIRKLLTRVDSNNNKQGEVRRSLTRFLRYHPINEFEPFFESMGLKPSEYSLLLPRQLIFINDDPVLLENYHVLCNYGILRKKIGKFYRESLEIFSYAEGVLHEKLKSFESMGLSQSTVIKVVVSSPRLLVGNVRLYFFEILEKLKVMCPGHFGIERNLLEGNSYNWRLMLETLHLLGKIGCNEQQLRVLIQNHPELLFDRSGTTALSLIGFLMKFGSTSDEICALFLQFPEILARTFLVNLRHSYRFLSEIQMAALDIGDIICSQTILLGSSATKKVDNLLSTMSVVRERLCEIVKNNPEVIKNWIVRKKVEGSKLYEPELRSQMIKTKFLLDLGFDEHSKEMIRSLKSFRGKGMKLQERFDCFVNAGLDPKDVADMVKIAPQILNLSTDVIERKIEFLVNDMGYPVSELVAFPAFVSYKIQRVKHRLEMYNWLKDQGAVKPNLALSTLLAYGENIFVRKFVKLHPKAPEVWERLKKSIYAR